MRRLVIRRWLPIILLGLSLTGLIQAANREDSDTPSALNLLAHEARDDDAGAQLLYGLAYLEGRDGLKPDLSKAIYWLRRSARLGNSYAQLTLGKLHADGKGVEKDMRQAYHWWLKAAHKGSPEAEFLVGRSLVNGEGVEKNPEQGIEWLTRAAKRNNRDAQALLGRLYLEGYAVKKNQSSARSWLERAASLGDEGAINLLHLLKKSVDASTRIYQESSEELEKRAETGDPKAEFELGMRYESGAWDVSRDDGKALYWIRQAASHGNRIAMETLADIYRHGRLGVLPDPDRAEKWKQKAER